MKEKSKLGLAEIRPLLPTGEDTTQKTMKRWLANSFLGKPFKPRMGDDDTNT